jgi:hypothetical protein
LGGVCAGFDQNVAQVVALVKIELEMHQQALLDLPSARISPRMDDNTAKRAPWFALGMSAVGGLILISLWNVWLVTAVNEAASPSNASSVRFLVGLVVAQAIATASYLLLLALWPHRRLALLTLLPLLVWVLVVLNVMLLSVSGFY